MHLWKSVAFCFFKNKSLWFGEMASRCKILYAGVARGAAASALTARMMRVSRVPRRPLGRRWASASSAPPSSSRQKVVDASTKRAKEAWQTIEHRIAREGSFVEKKAVELFDKWKRKYTWKQGAVFAALGGGAVISGTYAYFTWYPTEVEKIVVHKTLDAFAKALDFDARKLVYFSLPERNFPVPTTVEELISLANSSGFEGMKALTAMGI